ncbi:MAG: YbdD/YjiX family protein [Pseudomonadota bacterium]|jgi:hypothetical protein
MSNQPNFYNAMRDFLRGATGEGAYERYCEHIAKAHPEVTCPTRAEFFRAGQTERWHGVQRCC